MKFREYLADHISIILIFLFIIILSECSFLIFNITFELNVFILVIDIAGFLFSFMFSYFKKTNFLHELQKRTGLLDQQIFNTRTFSYARNSRGADTLPINLGD